MTENFDRLRKLAGIKPKQVLNESDRGLGTYSLADPDSSDFSLGTKSIPKAKAITVGTRVSGVINFGPYRDKTLTGTVVRLFPVNYAEIEWDNGYKSNSDIRELSLEVNEAEDLVAESTDEYDIGKPTDVYGQYKAKTPEPDFPVDMGEVFSTGSSAGSEGSTLASMDGGGEDHSEVSQSKASEEVASPKAFAEPKEEKADDYSDYFKSDDKPAKEEKAEPESDDSDSDEAKEEPKDDEGFDKKKVAEARRFYNLKRLVHRNIAEGTTDFGAAFMAGMHAFDRISDKLIVEHNINLTSEQEHKIAKAVAVELAYGKSTLDTIAESHSVEGRKQGSDYVFEFTDKSMAMIFLNEINESGNCIGRLRYNRGFVEAVVKSFE